MGCSAAATAATRAIQRRTNSLVNHVLGMSWSWMSCRRPRGHAKAWAGRGPTCWAGGRHAARRRTVPARGRGSRRGRMRYGQARLAARSWSRQPAPRWKTRRDAPSRGWTGRRLLLRPGSPLLAARSAAPLGEAVATRPWEPSTAPRSWPSTYQAMAAAAPAAGELVPTWAGSGAGTISPVRQVPGRRGDLLSRVPAAEPSGS